MKNRWIQTKWWSRWSGSLKHRGAAHTTPGFFGSLWLGLGGLWRSLGVKPYRRATPLHVATALHWRGSCLWGYALGAPLGAQLLLWHLASGASSHLWIKCWVPCSPWKNLPLGKWHRWEAAKQSTLHSYVQFCGSLKSLQLFARYKFLNAFPSI